MTEALTPRQQFKQKLDEIMGKLNLKQADDEDADQKFIKKDAAQTVAEQVGEIVDELKNSSAIKPESNQQRNLDREVGGLEAEEQKESSEKDVWDDRSEEVDKMGSTDTFNTTGMKSVVWKQKKDRLNKKRAAKHHAEAAGISLGLQQNTKGKSFDDMGYVDRMKHLRQDRSHENKGGRGI